MNIAIEQSFVEALAHIEILIDKQQLEQFQAYYRILVEWNERMNLTGITEERQVYHKHFYDSATLACFVPMEGMHTVADIGSGAGFPGIPLKILFPHLQLTIVDSLNKRIQFLNHVCESLGLNHVTNRHGRAEDLGRERGLRDHFDLVTARAVARLNILNEFCLPFVRKGGLFAAMKGTDPVEELAEAKYSLKELKAKAGAVHRLASTEEMAERHIVIVEKIDVTPQKYPRKAGIPMKTPLK